MLLPDVEVKLFNDASTDATGTTLATRCRPGNVGTPPGVSPAATTKRTPLSRSPAILSTSHDPASSVVLPKEPLTAASGTPFSAKETKYCRHMTKCSES